MNSLFLHLGRLLDCSCGKSGCLCHFLPQAEDCYVSCDERDKAMSFQKGYILITRVAVRLRRHFFIYYFFMLLRVFDLFFLVSIFCGPIV